MTSMSLEKAQTIIEAAIMVAGRPLNKSALLALFPDDEKPDGLDLTTILKQISARHEDSGVELQQTASGYRFQAKAALAPWLSRLWEERAPRYSKAFLETLSIIAYKQPITRAEIEDIRGVTVSSHIIKTLLEREWIRVIGHREIPGRPAILGTTKDFLDYFNLPSLAALPTLAELKDFAAQEEKLQVQLALEDSQIGSLNSDMIPEEREALIAEESVMTLIETSEEIILEDNVENNFENNAEEPDEQTRSASS